MTGVAGPPMGTEADAEFDRRLRALERGWVGLADKPHETPASTLRALWFAAAGDPRSVERAARGELPALTARELHALDRLVERRMAGEPLAYIVGRESFMGVELLCAPGALVPRRETELLGAAALRCVRRALEESGGAAASRAQVVDVCTGAGNLAVALAHHEPRCAVFGADLSPEAVALARRNAEHGGVSDRVTFAAGDLFAPVADAGLAGAVDVVVCNPPYISSPRLQKLPDEIARHEPRLAFDGGAFGISILFRLLSEAPHYLRPGGWLCFEVGAGQGEPMAVRLDREGYRDVERVPDERGETRALVARPRGSPAAGGA